MISWRQIFNNVRNTLHQLPQSGVQSMKKLILLFFPVVFLFCVEVQAQVPGLVQNCSNSLTWGFSETPVSSYILNCNQPTRTGNVVLVNLSILDSATAPKGLTITDNGAIPNTYHLLSTATSSRNGSASYIFCGVQANPASRFTVSASSNLGGEYVSESATEFFNVATGAGGCASADQSWQNDATTASTTVTAGTAAAAPTTTGDLIYQFTTQDTGTQLTGTIPFTPGSQSNITWHLVPGSAQNYDGNVAQYGVYSATTAINPTMKWSTSGQYISNAVALKAASSGSNCTGPCIRSVLHMDVAANMYQSGVGPNNNGSTFKLQVPTYATGDILVATASPSLNYDPTSIATTGGETWEQGIKADGDQNDGSVWLWYACNTTQSDTRVVTPTMGISGGETPVLVYDVSGLSTATGTGCLDTTGKNDGTQSTAGKGVTAFTTIAPSAANEMAIGAVGMQAGSAVASVTNWNSQAGNFFFNGGAQQECSAGQHPPSPVDECNGHASIVTSNTSTLSMVLNPTDSSFAFGEWIGVYGVFKAASVQPPAPVGLQAVTF
jgi:hypothetical protein